MVVLSTTNTQPYNMVMYDVIGYMAGGLTLISSIPQLLKIIKTKNVEGVSGGTFVILLCAQFLWTIYGFYKNDLQLIITNIVSGIISLCILVIYIFLSMKRNKTGNSGLVTGDGIV
jgi:MtN3 and saliva related transmembrane protein